mmetsp:Transcript_25322/g.83189  ORF Transcript_25322/g.83189 Transcript_25322/m.83189 type:complete len:712 (+) Transcript_25322:1072-3207(+)
MLEPVARPVLMHRQVRDERFYPVLAIQRVRNLPARREALPRVLSPRPPPLPSERVARRVANLREVVPAPLLALRHRKLVRAPAEQVGHLHEQPPEPVLAERPPLAKLEQAPARIRAEVRQVRVHRVRAAAKVDVVRVVKPVRFVAEVLRHLELVPQIASERVELAVRLAGARDAPSKGALLHLESRRRVEQELPRLRAGQEAGLRHKALGHRHVAPRQIHRPVLLLPQLVEHVEHKGVHRPARAPENVERVHHLLVALRAVAHLGVRRAQELELPRARTAGASLVPAHNHGGLRQVGSAVVPRPRLWGHEHRAVLRVELLAEEVLVVDNLGHLVVPHEAAVHRLGPFSRVRKGWDLHHRHLPFLPVILPSFRRRLRHRFQILHRRRVEEDLQEHRPELYLHLRGPLRIVESHPGMERDVPRVFGRLDEIHPRERAPNVPFALLPPPSARAAAAASFSSSSFAALHDRNKVFGELGFAKKVAHRRARRRELILAPGSEFVEVDAALFKLAREGILLLPHPPQRVARLAPLVPQPRHHHLEVDVLPDVLRHLDRLDRPRHALLAPEPLDPVVLPAHEHVEHRVERDDRQLLAPEHHHVRPVHAAVDRALAVPDCLLLAPDGFHHRPVPAVEEPARARERGPGAALDGREEVPAVPKPLLLDRVELHRALSRLELELLPDAHHPHPSPHLGRRSHVPSAAPHPAPVELARRRRH